MKTNSFIKIAGALLFGLFVSCEEKEDDLINCEISFESAISKDDDTAKTTMVFEATELESDENANYFWSIDGTQSNELSSRLEYTFTENGTYEICVFTETPECPNGVEYCKEITIENSNDTADGCPNISFTKNLISNDGLTYKFSASGAPESKYSWFINDEYVQNGLEGNDNQHLTYEFSKNGNYYICVGVETPECPKGIEYCVELVIGGADEITCTLDFETIFKESDDINSQKVVFEAFGSVSNSGIKYFWIIDGKDIKGENSDRLENTFYENGTYQVCVFTETPECPNGVEYCKEVIIDNIVEDVIPAFMITVDNPVQEKTVEACADLTYDYSISSDNVNKYVLEANIIENITDNYYVWYMKKNNDTQYEYVGSGRIFEYEFTEIGNYTIQVFIETPECPMGVTFSKDYTVEKIVAN